MTSRPAERPADRLAELSAAGVSIWLDDLSRERLESGNLADLVETSSVVGVTTNPTIFAAALKDGERYDDQVAGLTRGGASVDGAAAPARATGTSVTSTLPVSVVPGPDPAAPDSAASDSAAPESAVPDS